MNRFAALATLLLTVACGAPAASPESRIEAAAMLADVAALSDDAMEGRATGTPGKERAAAYIEERYRAIGLEPVGGSYRQAVNLVGMRRDSAASTLTIGGTGGDLDLRDGENVTFWSTAQEDVVDVVGAPLLFVGYGVEAPEHDWDDFKGVDLAGKVLLFLNNDPPVRDGDVELFGGEARTYYGRWTYKFEQAMRHGAAGALMVHTTPSASYPFSVVSGSGERESFALDLPGAGYQVGLLGWIDEALSEQIAAAAGTDLPGLFERAARRDFEPVDTGYTVDAHIETAVRQMSTENVVGMIPGSDPDVGDEMVVFTAHYDHIGVNETLEGDTLFNGAWDNAAGVAGILALAAAFAEETPRRSLLFLSCAAEESGSLGSAWFVAQPPVPKERLVANFNIDMPQIFGVTADLSAIGVEASDLGDALRIAAAEFSVERDGASAPVIVRGDPNPAAGSFYRSDQVNFAKAGIPALFVNPGVDHASDLGFDPGAYRAAHYHQPSDEIREEWDLSGLQRDMRIVFRAARAVADADLMPRWRRGNEFEGAWRRLHGLE